MATDSTPHTTEVLVIAEGSVVRLGLQAILEHADGLRVRVAGSGGSAVDEALSEPVSVVVVSSPRAPLLLRQHADAAQFVVVVDAPTDVMVVDLFAAGARGLVLSESAVEHLAEAVRDVRAGGVHIDPGAAYAVVAAALTGRRSRGPYGLTPREQRVLSLLKEGGTNRDIAEHLGISPETVKSHVRNIMSKLDASDRQHAVDTAREYGLI